MRIAGIVLIVLGILGFVLGGVTYTKRKDTVNIGPISASVRQKESVPISPVLSGIVLVAGIALVIASSRRRA